MMLRPDEAPPDPQMAAALARIGAHIGNAKKFRKAAALLRELLASGQLQRQAHGQLTFAALKASMQDPSLVSRLHSSLASLPECIEIVHVVTFRAQTVVLCAKLSMAAKTVVLCAKLRMAAKTVVLCAMLRMAATVHVSRRHRHRGVLGTVCRSGAAAGLSALVHGSEQGAAPVWRAPAEPPRRARHLGGAQVLIPVLQSAAHAFVWGVALTFRRLSRSLLIRHHRALQLQPALTVYRARWETPC